MIVVIVDIHVKLEALEAFQTETILNAEASRKESGIARFDFLQDELDPTHFQLIEVYRDAAAPLVHKESLHYQRWRREVEPMMQRARTSVRSRCLSPDDIGW